MKKVLFLTTLLLLSFTVTTFAQSSKEARAARREALKKEREERRALEAQQDSIAYMKAVEALNEGDFVYFVHSYYAENCDEAVIATAEYGAPLTAAVESGQVFGCQFHPEKSGEVGLNILRGFCDLEV